MTEFTVHLSFPHKVQLFQTSENNCLLSEMEEIVFTENLLQMNMFETVTR